MQYTLLTVNLHQDENRTMEVISKLIHYTVKFTISPTNDSVGIFIFTDTEDQYCGLKRQLQNELGYNL